MSKKIHRTEVLTALQTMYKHVSAAQGLLEQDGDRCIEVLKLLAEAQRSGSQGIVALMALCLEEKLDAVQVGLGDSAAEEIDQLIGLADFSLLNLCLSCREEVGRSLTEMRPDGLATTSSATLVADSERKSFCDP